MSRWLRLILLLTVGSAAGASIAMAQEPPDTIPPGYGRLSADVIAILLDAGAVQFRVTPLHPEVIRLLRPDVYAPLERLRMSLASDIADAALRNGVTEPTVFFVSAYAKENRATFDPENIAITNRSRYFRPLAIIPMSPLWSQHQIPQRETATAVFVYDAGIEVWEPMSIEYGAVVSTQWAQVLPLLERERSWVESQARQSN